VLVIEDLSIFYGSIRAVHGISLFVKEGEIVTLIGANGAGKTTILKTISGLLRPRSGSIYFLGKRLDRLVPHLIVSLGVSHVPERRGIFSNLTTYENLLVGAYQRRLNSSDFDKVYSMFPILKERKSQLAGTLSGGEQQMLAISRALLSQPKMLLLDEPSLGLAPQITRSIFQTVQAINKMGTTVLLVEQNANAALKIAHRGYVLEVGEIFCTDTSENLLRNENVKKAYLGEA